MCETTEKDGALVSHHGKGHAVDLMFVFGLVLSEWTVPARREESEFT